MDIGQTSAIPDPLVLEELQRKGEEVLAKCCRSQPTWSKRKHAMLPGLPKEKHRDLYTEAEKKKDKTKGKYDGARIDHNAEIIVYRALESLYDQREKLDHGSKRHWSDETDMIVLHSLHYTNQQFQYFVNSDIEPIEKEHDFVVILRDRAIVCIEVKRPRFEKGQPDEKKFKKFNTTFTSGRNQLKRIEALLGGIKQRLDIKADLKIFKFTAFPLCSKDEVSEKDVKRLCGLHLAEAAKRDILDKFDKECAIRDLTILFEEDIKCFGKWWEDNVIKRIPKYKLDVSTLGLESVLVGLSCIWHKSDGNLMTDIQSIDENLKSQKLYLNADHRPENFLKFSKLDPYSTIFKKYLGIDFITKDQNAVLAEDKLFLNGLAGSGKTILLQAKLIRLATHDGSKRQVIVFVASQDVVAKYKTVLEKANIKSEEIEEIDFSDTISKIKSRQKGASAKDRSRSLITKQCTTTLEARLENCQSKKIVFIYKIALNTSIRAEQRTPFIEDHYKCIDNLILQKDKYHILVDDFQSLLSLRFKDPDNCRYIVDCFVDMLTVNSPTSSDIARTTWIACDSFQILEFGVFGNKACSTEVKTFLSNIESGTKTKSLTSNLRNTLAIGNILGKIRKELITLTDIHLAEEQVPGHFINGPTPYVYCIDTNIDNSFPQKRVKNVINDELVQPNTNGSTSLDIVVIPLFKKFRRRYYYIFNETVGKLVRWLQTKADFKVQIESVFTAEGPKYTYSLEYPVGILIVDLTDDLNNPQEDPDSETFANILAHLYLGISRARVSCSIIFICDPNNPMFKQIIDILRDFVVIKVYEK